MQFQEDVMYICTLISPQGDQMKLRTVYLWTGNMTEGKVPARQVWDSIP